MKNIESIRKFILTKICSKEHPSMRGIYHEKGKIIATNGHIMVILACEYPIEYENKVVGKKGEELYRGDPETAFSYRYESVIPKAPFIQEMFIYKELHILKKVCKKLPEDLFQVSLFEGFNTQSVPVPVAFSTMLLGKAFSLFELIKEPPVFHAQIDERGRLLNALVMVKSENCTVVINHASYMAEHTYNFDLLW